MSLCNASDGGIDTIEITVGEDATFTITAFDAQKNRFDLTNAKIFFSVKKAWRDATPVIAKATLNAGGSDTQILVLTQTGTTKGQAQIFIVPSDTTVFTADEVDGSQWVYDVWLVTAAGKHKVVRKLRPFVLKPRVTEVP